MLGDTADLSEEEFAETWITRMSGCIATGEAADAAKPKVMFVLGGPGTSLPLPCYCPMPWYTPPSPMLLPYAVGTPLPLPCYCPMPWVHPSLSRATSSPWYISFRLMLILSRATSCVPVVLLTGRFMRRFSSLDLLPPCPFFMFPAASFSSYLCCYSSSLFFLPLLTAVAVSLLCPLTSQ